MRQTCIISVAHSGSHMDGAVVFGHVLMTVTRYSNSIAYSIVPLVVSHRCHRDHTKFYYEIYEPYGEWLNELCHFGTAI